MKGNSFDFAALVFGATQFFFCCFWNKKERNGYGGDQSNALIDFLNISSNEKCLFFFVLRDMYILCSVNCRKTFLFSLQRDLDPIPPPRNPTPTTFKIDFVSPRSHAMSSICLLNVVFAFPVHLCVSANHYLLVNKIHPLF